MCVAGKAALPAFVQSSSLMLVVLTHSIAVCFGLLAVWHHFIMFIVWTPLMRRRLQLEWCNSAGLHDGDK
jgi:hypothetical protein